MFLHVCWRVLLSSPSPGPLEGLGQRISTSVRNLGPLPRVSHPVLRDAEDSDGLSGQTWGWRLERVTVPGDTGLCLSTRLDRELAIFWEAT